MTVGQSVQLAKSYGPQQLGQEAIFGLMTRMKTFLKRSALSLAMLGIGATGAFANPTMIFDLGSGRVLQHEDAFKRWYPASLTKLMTAYVTFRAVQDGELQLNSPIRVTKHAAGEPPSKMGYKQGSVMTLDNALKMIIIKSANDIAMAIGENVGGSEKAFAARMNKEARRLGMTGSHFVNPNGLHNAQQYTTARDLALLVRAIRTDFPQYASYFSIEGLAAGQTAIPNYNLLVGRYPGADGMKTGFVCASGFNMIGTATRGGRTLVAIVLGEKSVQARAEVAAGLLTEGFAMSSAQPATVSSLPFYGDPAGGATDMREEVCSTKKPAAEQSEGPSAEASARSESPYMMKLANPKLVTVGLGGAEGPVPLARRGHDGQEVADVPVPTWRPDMPPPTMASQGDSSAGFN